jgi:predicted transcriptional regulator of viral defense system
VKLLDVHRRLLGLHRATFTTNDAVGALGVDVAHASKMLSRLCTSEHLVRLARGRWALAGQLVPFALPEALTAPKPSYVSLQSALYHHGLIEQIPDVVYAVTLAPTRRLTTPLGTVSLHHVAPEFFSGFALVGDHTVKLATAEKALVDTLYLTPARSRLFSALPELTLPSGFSKRRARSYLRLIESKRRRAMVSQRLEKLFDR